MKNILYVPDFRFNLLSVSKLTRELSCSVNFFPDFYVFQNLYNDKVKGIGKERGGLYVLKGDACGKKLASRIRVANAVGRYCDI